jgi:hypothetical protein
MTLEDTLPEEDELLDRCMEFSSLLTRSGLKNDRDVLFEFIHQAVMLRIKEELRVRKYTGYPTLHECLKDLGLKANTLDIEAKVYVTVQEMFVNKTLMELKKKGALTMFGGKMA